MLHCFIYIDSVARHPTTNTIDTNTTDVTSVGTNQSHVTTATTHQATREYDVSAGGGDSLKRTAYTRHTGTLSDNVTSSTSDVRESNYVTSASKKLPDAADAKTAQIGDAITFDYEVNSATLHDAPEVTSLLDDSENSSSYRTPEGNVRS